MAYIIRFDASNRADFVLDFSAVDVETNEDIDLTGAEVSIKIADEDGCYARYSAAIGNGITQLSSTVLELIIPAATMACFRPGTYQIGCNFSLDSGVTITQLFVGSFVVYEGVAAL